MNISIGIVGLPNVGKSTLFNALLKKQVADVANYPFCTIKPNVGVVEVPDERLPVLAGIVNTKKIVPAVVEFTDIAGLVKGASQGAGLGNQFLANIREVAAIAHVVRLFEDENVIRVSEGGSTVNDIETIEAELMLADLATLEKQKTPRANASKDEKIFYELVQILKDNLAKGIPVRRVEISEDNQKLVYLLNLLTAKPVIYVFNVSEQQLANFSDTEAKISAILQSCGLAISYVAICAKLENEILGLSWGEQREYLRQYNLAEPGLNRLIKKAYETLELISFLTAGEKEARAWTIKNGTLAPQAAGVIHTDFEKSFIRADVIRYESFVALGGWAKAREAGKVQTVGKDYTVRDGDVVEFKVGT